MKDDPAINMGTLLQFIIICGLNGICVAWTTAGNNQTANVIAAKLGWSYEMTMYNNSMINVCSQMGKTVGAFYGGKLIPIGRKKVFIGGNIVALISCVMQQYLSLPVICVGKFLNGTFVTIT